MIRNILVSQPRPTTKSPYFDLETQFDVKLTFRPFIKVEGLSAVEFRKQKVNILDYTAIVFTSRHAIDHFFNLCREMRITMPESMKYFAPSETIALYIQKYVQYRKRKVFFGSTGKWADLIPVMVKHKAEKYLLLQSEQHSDEQARSLDEKKLKHRECVMYRTVSVPFSREEQFNYDMVVLFTPAGVNALRDSLPAGEQGNLKIATLGKAAAQAVEDSGLTSHITAPSPKAPSMPLAIAHYLKEEIEKEQRDAKASVTKIAKPARKPAKDATAPRKTAARKSTTPKATAKTPTAKAAAPTGKEKKTATKAAAAPGKTATKSKKTTAKSSKA